MNVLVRKKKFKIEDIAGNMDLEVSNTCALLKRPASNGGLSSRLGASSPESQPSQTQELIHKDVYIENVEFLRFYGG